MSATSSDQSLLPDENIVVTGNGPEEPYGSFTNGSLEGSGGWGFDGAAEVWDGRARTGSQSLRLEKPGGRAEQTITGLQPNTKYMVGGWYNLELQWNDRNGDGYVDQGDVEEGEPTFPARGQMARFEWGVEDVDASLPGVQREYITRQRDGSKELNQWWSAHEDDWLHDTILLTTGPETTEVTLYVDNTATADNFADSNLSFDDLYIKPVVPADRAVTMRPEESATGEATVTLTATDADDEVIGTEDFAVTVSDSSFTNGGLDADPAGDGWDFRHGGAEVAVDDPFELNRVLELARGENNGTVSQEVTGLAPDTEYVLEASGRLAADSGEASVVVNGHGGPQSSVAFDTADWETKETSFTTGPDSTSATVLALDWTHGGDADAWSLIDDIRIYPADAVNPTGGPEIPSLEEMANLQIPSSSSGSFSFDSAGTAITGVSSDNPHVLPDANVGVTGSDRQYVLAVSPVSDRTGKATVRVFTNEAKTEWHDIVTVISERHLGNPGFESSWADGWSLSDGAAVTEESSRSGDRALELPSGGTALQELPTGNPGQATELRDRRGVACITPLAIGGWASGDVTLTVRTPDGQSSSIEWTGSDWSEGQTTFVSTGCYFPASQSRAITLEITGSGTEPAFVDDLHLFFAPKIGPIRDMSVHEDVKSFGWPHRREVLVGRITDHALWDPDLVSVSSSDESVLPSSNIELIKPGDTWSDHALMYSWRIQVIAGEKTGRSDVTLAVTDPATRVKTEETFTVTVNAGATLDNGDLERGLPRNPENGWQDVLAPFRDPLVRRRATRYNNPLPTDFDQVLRISHRMLRYPITGLDPNMNYVVDADAYGEGSRLLVRDGSDPDDTSDPIGEVRVDSTDEWAPVDFSFTTVAEQTEVWLFIEEDNLGDRDPPGYQPGYPRNEPCEKYKPDVSGTESCYDNIGLFRAADLN